MNHSMEDNHYFHSVLILEISRHSVALFAEPGVVVLWRIVNDVNWSRLSDLIHLIHVGIHRSVMGFVHVICVMIKLCQIILG